MAAATTGMTRTASMSDPSKISVAAARLAIAAAAVEILLLAGLHMLSPEFDPSWRVVSEYATGQYGWVLSLMFLAGALSIWSLAFAIRPQVGTNAGKLGLGLLIASASALEWPSHLISTIRCTTWRDSLGFSAFHLPRC